MTDNQAQNKKLSKILAIVSDISMGDLSKKIKITGEDEFAALGTAINEMNSSLKRYNREMIEKILGVVSDVAMGDFSKKIHIDSEDSFAALGIAINEIIDILRHSHEKLKELSETDQLTNIPNRRKLFDFLRVDVASAKRHSTPLSIAMLDIDHFKKINDKFGHLVGDTVLKNTATVLRHHIRKADVLGRFGGDEFVIIMTGNRHSQAKILCEKLQKLMAKHRHHKVGPITISAGIAEFTEKDSEETLFLKADKALYRAKEKGRNRVEI